MINQIVALFVKLSGGGWIWKVIDGKKTFLGALGKMLAGGASMLAGAAKIVMAVVACEELACVIEIARGIPQDPNALLVVAGWYGFASGLEGIGLWHKIQKGEKQVERA